MSPKLISSTEVAEYADHLILKKEKLWKKLLPVQAPYAWNLRRLKPGFVLDIGCGWGRNLKHLNGNGIGIDTNPELLNIGLSSGLRMMSPEDFRKSKYAKDGLFDSLLLSHVAEHMSFEQVCELVARYLRLVKPGGQLIVITPQEKGFVCDPTHVEFFDFEKVEQLFNTLKLCSTKKYSFPFPRFVGRYFPYNEFVCIAKTPEDRAAT